MFYDIFVFHLQFRWEKGFADFFVVPYEFQANKENIPKYFKNTKIPKMKIS